MTYEKFENLPVPVQDYIKRLEPVEYRSWVTQPVPILKGLSILELANTQGIEAAVAHLYRIAEMGGVSDLIQASGHDG